MWEQLLGSQVGILSLLALVFILGVGIVIHFYIINKVMKSDDSSENKGGEGS